MSRKLNKFLFQTQFIFFGLMDIKVFAYNVIINMEMQSIQNQLVHFNEGNQFRFPNLDSRILIFVVPKENIVKIK